jgi:hypothetical protein
MPNHGKWITRQNAFRFFADGEPILFPGAERFSTFYCIFSSFSGRPGLPLCIPEGGNHFQALPGHKLVFLQKRTKGEQEE